MKTFFRKPWAATLSLVLLLALLMGGIGGVSGSGQDMESVQKEGVDLAAKFANLTEVISVTQPRVNSSHTYFLEVFGLTQEKKRVLTGVDLKTGEIVRMVRLCPETPIGAESVSLSQHNALQRIYEFLSRNDLPQITDDFSLESAEVTSIGPLKRWEFTWRHVVNEVKVAPDFIRFMVNPETGEVFVYSKVRHDVVVDTDPTIAESEAIKIAREKALGMDTLSEFDPEIRMLDAELQIVYPNRYFDKWTWEWSEEQALAWIVTFGDEEPAIDVWVDAHNGKILGGEVYEKPIPELYGIPNQQGDITGIWEPALDKMMYDTSNTWLTYVSEATVINSIANGTYFILHTHGTVDGTIQKAAINYWDPGYWVDSECLNPDEVPNNDLRYALVSCCHSGDDIPGPNNDFKEVFINQGADVFQGYSPSINPDPYETVLVRYLAEGRTLANAHNLAVAATGPDFTIVFTYNVWCINQVRLAPLLVDVSAPSSVSPWSSFKVTATVTNREDARGTTASNVRAKLVLPPGFTVIGGPNLQLTGSLAHYSSWSAKWTVSPSFWLVGGKKTFDVQVWSDNLGVEVDDFDNPYHRFDVHVSWFFPHPVLPSIFDRLFQFRPDGAIWPMLVRSWEISDDGMELVLHLREGVTFHDEEPFTSEAVAFNLEKEIYLFPGYSRLPIVESGLVDSVECIDDYTLKISLAAPNVDELLSLLAGPAGMMASPVAVEAFGEEFAYRPVGAGPFRFVEMIPDERVYLTAYERYWAGRPRLEKIVYFLIPEEASRLMALMSGELDAIVGTSPEVYERLSDSPEFLVCGTPTYFQAMSRAIEGFECYPYGILHLADISYPHALRVGLPEF